MGYRHLSPEERHYIEIERKRGISINQISKALGRHHSTILRELSRNTGERGYRHKQATRLTEARHRNKTKAVKLTQEIKQRVAEHLREDWSPEQIAGRLKRDNVIRLHHETIYQYILSDKRSGGMLYKHLRHQGKTYRKRYGSTHNRTGIPNRVDIEDRPEVANLRKRIGDWEADTVIRKGHQGAIITLDERRSKLRLAAPLTGKKAVEAKDKMIELLNPLKGFVLTVTFDNGKEFAHHEAVAEALDCKTYFAKPYHSWERGQNENANGLLRQYFPKSMLLTDINMEQVEKAVDKLNSRPRKCLKFRTPYEAFKDETGVDVKNLIGCALMT